MPDEESTDVIDLLGERDLDLISMVSGLHFDLSILLLCHTSMPLQQCTSMRSLITKSDQPIVADSMLLMLS
ncbi:hypothetical protein HAX54_004608 [Datura stramonium]|uniref:Uncharacterized protein n=1 Tax=Datura stramonium TaxID=4076 RepID=A0ABS8T8K6_DATST|nr:hypothetical protein [Datura stramonium]